MAVDAPLVLTVIGTRPEALKMAPVLRALANHRVRSEVCVTGQHPDLVGPVLDGLQICPDHLLGDFTGPDLAALTAHVLTRLPPILDLRNPAWVLVHGDTTSAVAATLAAVSRGIDVAHVEAGLRTGDPAAPFPEELNRRLIDALASLHLAPTQGARDNLLAEGIDPDRIHVTGNPIVDALDAMELEPGGGQGGQRVLVTCHRRETQGAGLDGVCRAVKALARPGRRIVWPVHPSPAVAPVVRRSLAQVDGVTLVEPLDHMAFLQLLASAHLVVTDSGGVQEEAALLGRPTLVIRERTERPEVLATGVVRLVGLEPRELVKQAEAWLANPPRAEAGTRPLGDGKSGPRIARILLERSCTPSC